MNIRQDALPTEEEVFVLFDNGEVITGHFAWDDYPNRKIVFSNDCGSGEYDVERIEKWVTLESAKDLVFNK